MSSGDVGKAFADGEVIFREGDPADCLYIIQSGKVTVYREEAGREIVLAELGAGESFGDMGVFMGPVRSESARSTGGARIITADYKFVLKKFRDDPSFAFRIIETMARRDRERKVEEERSEEARDKSADFYEFASVGAIDLDGDGVIRGTNRAGAELLGVERHELPGRPFEPFLPPEDREPFRNHLRACAGSPEGVMTELRIATRGAAPVRVQLFSYPKQGSGTVVYRTLVTELASRQEAE
jgi:PAS domain S-box-containing protein